MHYPPALRSDTVDTFKSIKSNEVQVPNPYDWLENLNSDETVAFINAQNAALDGYLADPELGEPKENVVGMLHSMMDQVVMRDVPRAAGGYYLLRVAGRRREFPVTLKFRKELIKEFIKTSDVSHQDPALQDQLEVFHDEAETGQILISSGVSHSGKYWAYNSSFKGSDWGVIRVKDIQTSRTLSDEIHDTLFDNKSVPITWLGDRGFFYLHWPPQGELRGNPQLRFHTLGRSQAEDEVVYHDATHPGYTFSVAVSDDQAFVFLHIYAPGNTSQVWAARVQNIDGEGDRGKNSVDLAFDIKICDDFESQWEYLGLQSRDGPQNRGSKTLQLFWTDKDNGQVLGYALDGGAPVTIIGPCEAQTLKLAKLIGENRLLAVRSVDLRDQLQVFSLTVGQLVDTLHTPIWTVLGASFDASTQDLFLHESSFCHPFTLWHIDGSGPHAPRTEAPAVRPLKLFPESGKKMGPVSTRQVFYSSKDGTKIPMFLTSEDSYPVTAQTPVLLYVYGGFGLSVIPHFRPDYMTFIRGFHGVLAVANVRGGGEYGHSWYLAACKAKRQALFDDIHSAVHYLKNTVGSETVILMGESMGGLNCMAAINQQPDLVSAAILNAGVFDILRKKRLGFGERGKQDLGDEEVPAEFDSMYSWSPLENLRMGCKYPPALLTAGDSDDLVAHTHSCKMAASLQHIKKDVEENNAVHLRIVRNLGHGANISALELAKLNVERWLWVKQMLGLTIFPLIESAN